MGEEETGKEEKLDLNRDSDKIGKKKLARSNNCARGGNFFKCEGSTVFKPK
jgi:hypothetical protein